MELERKYIINLLNPNFHTNMGPTTLLDWDKILKMAFAQGVANLIYLELKNSQIPSQIKSIFEKSYENTLVLNLLNLQAIENIEQICQNEKINVMTLKGASLLDHIYTKAGMRPMTDIDLMVRPCDLPRFEMLLEQLEYRRSAELTHIFKKGHSIIDLHTHALNTDRIASRKYLFPQGMDPVWEQAQSWKPGFLCVKNPHHTDNVLLLSQHFMKHSFSKLIWLVDIYRLLQAFKKRDWQKLKERALLLEQERPLSYSIFLLHLYFDYHPPPESGFETSRVKINLIEKTILKNSLFDVLSARLGPLISLFCVQGFKNRTRFALENLFPGEKVVGHEFKKYYTGKRIWLYPVRFIQALALIAKQFIGVCLTCFLKK